MSDENGNTDLLLIKLGAANRELNYAIGMAVTIPGQFNLVSRLTAVGGILDDLIEDISVAGFRL